MPTRFQTVLVATLVLLAGCSGFGQGGAPVDETTTGTTTAPSTTAGTTAPGTTTPSGTTAGTASQTDTTTAQTTARPWSEPDPPNKPLQNKMGEEDFDRIHSVSVDDGGSTVTLTVTANTSMDRVDPASHGTVRGEPYFLVYIDGSLRNESRFSYANGTLAERSRLVVQDRNGEYTLTIKPGAFDAAGVDEGSVQVMILLMDEDSEWDDVYAIETVTVEYGGDES